MMEEKYFGYIYKVTNGINGKFYIGKHGKPKFDENYWGSGKLIKMAINKYGRENFFIDVLEWCYTEQELNDAEKYWISIYDATDLSKAYNIALGGEGNSIFAPFTDEHKLKISISLKEFYLNHTEAHMGDNNPNYGKKASEETRKKLSIAFKNSAGVKNSTRFKNHKHSNESKLKISESCKQNIWITNGTDEMMVDKHLALPEGWTYGRLKSDEYNNRQIKIETWAHKKHPGLTKKVRCVELNLEFDSINKAVKFCNSGHVADCCYGKRNTAGGYHWEFIDE